MATVPSLTSLDAYLAMSYSPDCEYIDGVVLERNVGKGRHAYTQGEVLAKLRDLVIPKALMAIPELRVKVAAARVRIPDICVVEKLEEIVTAPPRLCIEVLSPDDRWSRVNESIRDYQAMGVPCIWVVDPYSSRAWIFDEENPPREVHDGRLVAQQLGIEVPLPSVLP